MKLTKIAKHINRTNNKKQLSEEDKKKIYQLKVKLYLNLNNLLIF